MVDRSNLKAFADSKVYVTEKVKIVLEMLENIMRKGENAGYHFLLFLIIFSKGSFVKSQDCVVKS